MGQPCCLEQIKRNTPNSIFTIVDAVAIVFVGLQGHKQKLNVCLISFWVDEVVVFVVVGMRRCSSDSWEW